MAPDPTTRRVNICTNITHENGIGAMEMVLRWAVHDSPLKDGDRVIFGARNEEKLGENAGWIEKGSLGKIFVGKLLLVEI